MRALLLSAAIGMAVGAAAPAAARPPAAQAPAPQPSGPTAPDAVAADAARVEAAFRALPEAERKARLDAARRLAVASEWQDQFAKSLATTSAFVMPMFLRGNEARQGDVLGIVNAEFKAETDRLLPLMVEQAAQRHAEVFTAAELDQMTAFYTSPTGKRIIAETATLQARMMRDGGTIGQVAMQSALPRILDRLKAANLAVPST